MISSRTARNVSLSVEGMSILSTPVEGNNKFSVEIILTPDVNEPQYPGSKVMDLTPFRACPAMRGLPPDPRADYALYNYRWKILNPMYTPAAYFLPRSTADVQAGVRCGRQLRLPFAIGRASCRERV